MHSYNLLIPIRQFMGNSPSPSSDCAQSILSSYTQMSKVPLGTILLHKATQVTYLLKQFTYGNDIQFQTKLTLLQQEVQKGVKDNVISVVKAQSQEHNNFCSSSFKIYAVYQYPQVTLKEQIEARQKEGKQYEQAQLWSILQSCTNALAQLRPTLCLSPSVIFINPDGHLKVIHSDLIQQSYRLVLQTKTYYAPEKLKQFNRQDTQANLKKQSIFSMGMTLLHAAQLNDAFNCYDYNQQLFLDYQLEVMLQKLMERYSQDFIQILANILEPNPNRRVSLMEVQKMLESYWNNDDSKIESSNDQYVGLKPVTVNFDSTKLQNVIKGKEESGQHQQWASLICRNPSSIFNFSKAGPNIVDSQTITPKLSLGELIISATNSLVTPKYHQPSDKENIYTDPKLFEMIRRDLDDISKLKQNAFYEAQKFTYHYPRTESILSSIKNMDNQHNYQQICSFPLKEASYNIDKTQYSSNRLVEGLNMMKKDKDKPRAIFTIQAYEDGRRYEGMMLEGRKNGAGKLIFEDGAYYKGEFKEDIMHGKGTLYYAEDIPAYDGMWQDDQFHGFGTLYNEHPQQLYQPFDYTNFNEVEEYWVKYEGMFHMDNKEGQGKLYLANGEMIEGQFKDDCINGSAVFTNVVGQEVHGNWQFNTLLSFN